MNAQNDPDLSFDREQEREAVPLELPPIGSRRPEEFDQAVADAYHERIMNSKPLEFGHLNPEPLFPEPEPVPPSPRPEPTLENIENTIRFTDRLVQGIYTDADGPRPYMEKQGLLAALYQAHALTRIADALEQTRPRARRRTARRMYREIMTGL